MSIWRTRLAAVSAALAVAFLAPFTAGAGAARATPAGPAQAVRVNTQARALRPGEVVLITVRTTRPADTVTGRTPADALPFTQSADPLQWEALLGLDRAVEAGAHRLTIRVETAGVATDVHKILHVRPKRFPVRRITVDDRFANPPASELPRIEREARALAAALAAVSPVRLWQGPFEAPVPGPPTSAFGRVSIVNGSRRSPHAGTDFQAATGTPVKAPNAGTVVLSESLYLAGDTVVIDHGLGVFSLLAHLSARHVAAGAAVSAGQVIGLSGVTGRITGPHLHWAVRIGKARVDPLSLLAVRGTSPH